MNRAVVAAIALGSALAGSAMASAGACERADLEVLIDLARRFADRSLDVTTASQALGRDGHADAQGGGWLIQGRPGCQQVVVLPRPGHADADRSVELRLPSTTPLRLSDLYPAWGATTTTVHESKDSSVRFDLRADDGSPVQAYVHLGTRRVDPHAPVRRVQWRRGD